jgi:hypothetical protein
MKSFREKHPGLTEEQLKIKYKIWEREKERERQLNEAAKKKKYKDPFRRDDDDGEEGSYDGSLDVEQNYQGIVSDAAIADADVTFLYQQAVGTIKYTKSDSNGNFSIPRSFGSGTIIVNGGIDSVTGIPYTGEFRMDGPFFHKYKAVTPVTHIANHIWNGTPSRIPEEAMNASMDYIFHFMGIPHTHIDNSHILFNGDHVKLTIDGFNGAKNIQAINTLIEIYADLIGALKANNIGEFAACKIQTYTEIGNGLLTRVNGQEMKEYFNNTFKFHISGQDARHDDCCLYLLDKAHTMIKSSLDKSEVESTAEIQAINYMIKNEWVEKALSMTEDNKIDPSKLWRDIKCKNAEEVFNKINLPIDGGLSL